MANLVKLLSGREIIHHKLNGPKDLPTSGWKEYCPSNSWLEQKQIQACLEDKCATIGVERIEKQHNLGKAEWVNECKKARVLKKVGKYWEVVGHHQDNEDWLLPEEALYLIEINVLELYLGGVPLSVEHAFALLLSESHDCTLQEYRVYSYLSRRGYKLIRHAEDITVTRYEKQIHLDQVLETQKRNIPTNGSESNLQTVEELSSSTNEIPESIAETTKSVEEIVDNSKEQLLKRAISDSEDLCIIEDNVEIIEIEDNALKKSSLNKLFEESTASKQLKNQKQVKINKTECVIIIDDEENEFDNEDVDIKHESESESSEYCSDDDVILVKSVRLESRDWYKPLRKCLVPSEVVVVDLSDDVEVKVERNHWNDECLQIVANKNRNDILDEMTNAKGGVSFIKTPNAYFLPKEIVPKHSQYRVNLNMRQEPSIQHSGPLYIPGRRQQQQYFNPSISNNQTNNTFLGDSMLMQACEMRAMAISMIQAASSLMTAMNSQSAMPNPPLMNDIQIPPYYNPPQFPNLGFSPRMYNNNMFNNNNMYNNNLFGNPRNTFMGRNTNFPYGRRNVRFRGYRNNSNRTFSPHQRQMSRFYSRNTNSNLHEVVMIDSDDDSVIEQQRIKRRGNHIEIPSKKSRQIKSIEIIDLCDDKQVKNEPIDSVKNRLLSRKNTLDKENQRDNTESDDKKPNIEVECKQEILNLSVEERLHTDVLLVEAKKEENNLLNVDDTDIKSEKLVDDAEKELISEIEIINTCKTEVINKEVEITDKGVSESPLSNMEIGSTESSRIIEESNDSEVANIMESSIPESETFVPEKEIAAQEPTSWQQFKEQTEQNENPSQMEVRMEEGVIPLTQPDQVKDIAILFRKLQIFDTIDEVPDDGKRKKLKISFDAYLPVDHFKKTMKMLPKFRVIVVNSRDSLPSKLELDILKSTYEDGIPFLYAIVCDDTIAFYYYEAVSLPEYCYD